MNDKLQEKLLKELYDKRVSNKNRVTLTTQIPTGSEYAIFNMDFTSLYPNPMIQRKYLYREILRKGKIKRIFKL